MGGPPGPACPLCRGTQTASLPGYAAIPPGGWDIWGCAVCGTGFLHPFPAPEELARAYDADYYGQGPGKFVSGVEGVVGLFRRRRAALVHRLAPAGPVLDVGCGRGLMLARLAARGREVAGVELDTEAARRTLANAGVLPVRSLDDIAGRRFAAVTFWHSLEHLSAPGQALEQAAEMLVPGGILLAAVPNFGSTQSRRSGIHWLHLDLPRHLCHFTASGLRRQVEGLGLRLELEDHYSLEYNPIDSLCHLYRRLGFGPRYPFDALRNVRGLRGGLARLALAALLAPPLGLAALGMSWAYSAAGNGSTVAMAFRKP
jgi:SAM-dependent methyltransferase